MAIKRYAKHYKVETELDVARITMLAAEFAKEIGFAASARSLIVIIISELGKNILNHAGKGSISLYQINEEEKDGLEINAQDEGPGIKNIEQALEEHFSTKGTLGLGLPAVKRLSDEFTIESTVGKGTFVTVRKWLKNGKY